VSVHEADEQLATDNLLVILKSEGCPIGLAMGTVTRIFHHTDTESRSDGPPPPADFPRLELTEISGARPAPGPRTHGWTALVQTTIGPVAVGAETFVGIEDLGAYPIVPLARLDDGSFGIHLQFREETPLMIFSPDLLAQRVRERHS
jgi:hypothetical protein